jgi:hypothetical protein
MSFLTAAAIVGGSALVSGYMGSQAAKEAARIQGRGIDAATAEQRRQYNVTREDYAPYRESGLTALKDIEALKPLLTAQFGPEQMQQYLDPSMDFRRQIGEQTTARALNVGGGFLSGNTLRGLTDYGQNLASTEYSNAFNRFQTDRGNIYNTLSNIAGMGMGATNQGAQYGQAAAQNIGQLAVGGAQAQAAGTIGSAQAYQNAFSQIGDLAMLYGLGKSGFLKPSGAGQPTVTSMFGGGNPIA